MLEDRSRTVCGLLGGHDLIPCLASLLPRLFKISEIVGNPDLGISVETREILVPKQSQFPRPNATKDVEREHS